MAFRDAPDILTGRLRFDDSHTLERFLATGGYDGLRAALARPPAEIVGRSRRPACAGAEAPVSPPDRSGASCRPTCFRATSS